MRVASWCCGVLCVLLMWGCSTPSKEERSPKERRGGDVESVSDTGGASDAGKRDSGGLESPSDTTTRPDPLPRPDTVVDAEPDSRSTPEASSEPAGERAPEARVAPERGQVEGGGADTPAKICSFNKDCPASQRCECAKGDCFCRTGARGTGKSGVDSCKDGNDCASALCVEGNGGNYYCSGECQSAKDCGPQLPICARISFVGQICIRKKK